MGRLELPTINTERSNRRNHLALLLGLLALLALSKFSTFHYLSTPVPVAPLHSGDLAACTRDSAPRHIRKNPSPGRVNSRLTFHQPFVIRNATVFDGDGALLGTKDLFIVNGTLMRITKAGSARTQGWNEVDVEGRFLTPGIVDMHTHAGVRSLPQYEASEDVTEIAGPVTPQMKAIDGFDPSDEALLPIIAGGATSSLVLTGASNSLSGQGMAIKHRRMPSLSIEQMQVRANEDSATKREQYLKMACGENPKKKGSVQTRLGEGAALRKAYERAQTLKEAQDDWCASVPTVASRYPRDYELQFLVDVLRGDVLVNVHCYKTEDIEMMLRLSDEFNFKINSLHHATETWRMLDTLEKYKPLTIAIFGGEYGFKPETMMASVNNGAVLHESGFNVSYVSDHPALNGQFPMREAAMGFNFGLSQEAALASVFGVPAAAMGIADRVGYIRTGYDADLILWDDHPLKVGASPLQVWIDGETQLHGGASEETSISWKASSVDLNPPAQRGTVGLQVETTCQLGAHDLVLRQLTTRLHPVSQGLKGSGAKSDVLVRRGQIACIGECQQEIKEALMAGAAELTFETGAYLLPGVTTVTPMHGLTEMLMEPSTSDGYVSGSDIHATHAHYGLTVAGVHVKIANMVGITSIVTAPRAKGPSVLERTAAGGFIRGVSMAFRTGIRHAADEASWLKKDVAMHVTLGHPGKSIITPTISSQFDKLHRILNSPPDEDWAAVLNGSLPLAVHADSADVIAQIALLKDAHRSLNVVVIGGAEAWIVAEALSQRDIGVILAPWRCMALMWDSRRCHHGVPLKDETAVSVLMEAGVRVGLASPDDKGVRNMWWEAGWASKTPSMRSNISLDKDQLAIDLLSNNVNELLGLEVDHASTFSVWEGNPFEYGAIPAVIFDRGRIEQCYPNFEVV